MYCLQVFRSQVICSTSGQESTQTERRVGKCDCAADHSNITQTWSCEEHQMNQFIILKATVTYLNCGNRTSFTQVMSPHFRYCAYNNGNAVLHIADTNASGNHSEHRSKAWKICAICNASIHRRGQGKCSSLFMLKATGFGL